MKSKGMVQRLKYFNNINAMLFKNHGKAFSVKKTKHINMRYFLSPIGFKRRKTNWNII